MANAVAEASHGRAAEGGSMGEPWTIAQCAEPDPIPSTAVQYVECLAPASSRASPYNPPVQPGERLGPYEILAPLGTGGMGTVYSARDTRLGRTVAIKRIQAEFSDRFEREARTISALN